ncbi:transposase [Listeria welshimeri]|nr:transposase [Listeria welshimeri]MBC1644317.1 transposase [Listeria welshimeri]MBC1646155.1 transposase [Listeria welshimeri]MBC1658189.1 transposase [Listeria welshimeri]MBC1670980.1 transposase [Listeria welshimeri]
MKETETKKIYAQNKIDVEPAFGYLKTSLRLTRLSVRGKEKVKNELVMSQSL